MRLYRYATSSGVEAGVLIGGRLLPIRALAPELAPSDPGDLDEIVQSGRLPALAAAAEGTDASGGPRPDDVDLLAPLVRPPKIWCIGLNYRAHAADLDAKTTPTPVGFMRPNASIIGPGDTVRLPRASQRVTGEGELVIVLGRSGQDIAPDDALSAVGAYTLAVDMTAEDILRQNARFLTRAKSFDTFLSLGPCLVTPDEVATRESLPAVRTSTLLNGERARSALVEAMTHPPEKLISFFSEDMTWKAGDILLTGTPGAVVIEDGDVVGAEVEAIGRLENPVRRLARLPLRRATSCGDASPADLESDSRSAERPMSEQRTQALTSNVSPARSRTPPRRLSPSRKDHRQRDGDPGRVVVSPIDITRLMDSLARKRPVFHSEADFQHTVAWQIREETGLDVRLEFPPFPDERIHLDVWVPDAGLAIELKYSTRKLNVNVSGEGFALRDQAAGDLCHYDFLRDVTRLERVATNSTDARGGVAVLLTNDWLHWKPPEPPDTAIGAEFRVHQGRRLHGMMSWSPRAGPGSIKGRESPIVLSGSYRCHWKNYGLPLSVDRPRGAQFRYLAIGVQR